MTAEIVEQLKHIFHWLEGANVIKTGKSDLNMWDTRKWTTSLCLNMWVTSTAQRNRTSKLTSEAKIKLWKLNKWSRVQYKWRAVGAQMESGSITYPHANAIITNLHISWGEVQVKTSPWLPHLSQARATQLPSYNPPPLPFLFASCCFLSKTQATTNAIKFQKAEQPSVMRREPANI